MRPRHAIRAGLAVALGASLLAVPAAPVVAAERPPGDPAPLSRAAKVAGVNAQAKPIPVDPVWEGRQKGTPAVTWPAAGTADVPLGTVGTQSVRAGGLPVRLKAPAPGADGTAPAQVSVELFDRARADAAGVTGSVLTLRRSDGVNAPGPVEVELDYSGFRAAFGGDWGSRLRIVSLPECAVTTPEKSECQKQTPLKTGNSFATSTASARVVTSQHTGVYALSAAPEGSTGDYKATSLSPSATWQTALQSGSFSVAQDFAVPSVPGGLVPKVGLSYSSGSVDGRTVATNNQPSWVGEGWNLWSGYVSWGLSSCVDQGVQESGDLCWTDNQASIVFNGKASPLVYDSGQRKWRLKDDDGSRVDLWNGANNGDHGGDYWRVTTTDGTQYFFGRHADTQSAWTVPMFGNNDNEPCKKATFAESWCQQAWRWNLDYVVDRAGNTIKYFYTKETNAYGINLAKGKADYTRGGVLDRIEYGGKDGQSTGYAEVRFDNAQRCQEGSDCARKESFPDVPFDRECTGATCPEKYSPTFWTTKRLAKVSTFLAGQLLDTWTLEHGFPANGDGTAAGLWLQQVTHTGHRGGTALSSPPTKYHGTPEPNRINTAQDGLPPMLKHRIHTIYNESGGKTEVNWKPHDCEADTKPAPENNTKRCFPQRWAPPGAAATDDWFRKYVVGEVLTDDRVGGSLPGKTTYEYGGGGAWHYDDNPLVKADYRSWTQWRGYAEVKVRTGNTASQPDVKQTEMQTRYYRGMHGDRLNKDGGSRPATVEDSAGVKREDSDGLQGFKLEERTLNGVDGPEISGSLNEPVRKQTGAQGSSVAYSIRVAKTLGRTTITGGPPRKTEVVNTYDDDGFLKETKDLGDVATAEDDRCTTTTYARNRDTWVLDLPSQSTTVGVACGVAAVFPRDSISDVRTYYDGREWNTAPAAGYATKVERVRDYQADGKPVYLVDSETSYDASGRVLTSQDALKRKTTTTYEPQSGVPAAVTVTNPKGHKTVTEYEVNGVVKATKDVNGRKTELAYDPQGRLTGVWRPGRVKGTDGPHIRYGYQLRNDGTSWVSAEELKANQNYQTGYILYDGFMRARQTQSPAWLEPGTPPGRVVTDTIHDSRGVVVKQNAKYYAEGAAGGTLLTSPAGDAAIPSQTRLTYDGAARVVRSEQFTKNQPASAAWFTTTEYRGDMTVVTPAKGGTKTATLVDARGRQTEVRQLSAGIDVTTTKYTYSKAGQLDKITDTSGNDWTYGHDVLGRTVTRSDPDKGASVLTYDDAGQLKTRTDARQKVITYDYDELGRTTATWDGNTKLTELTYDPAGALGQVATSTRFTGGVPYKSEIVGYDDGYRPTEEVITVPASEAGLAGTYRTVAEYNPNGTLKKIVTPKLGADLGGEEVKYGYDEFGLLSSVTGSETYVGYTRYTEFGEPEMIRRGKVNAETWTRWDYGVVTRRVAQLAVDRRASTTYDSDMRYTYDESGNITKLTTAMPGQTFDAQCFGYDYLRRMTQSWSTATDCGGVGQNVGGPAPYWTSYTYDAVGNRATETEHGLGGNRDTVRKSSYPAAKQARPHAPLTVTVDGPQGTKTEAFGYTETGTVKSRPGPQGVQQSMNWDTEDRLASTSAGTGYVYGLDGSRLISRDDKGSTLYLPTGEVRWDKTANKASGTRYYPHNGNVVGMRTAVGVTWLSQDTNGTDVVAVTGTTVTTRRLDPFGELRGAPVAWPSTRGFVGGVTEAATGLTSLGVRAYDPAGGKFVAVDPVLKSSDPDHLNGYSYAKNSPITLSDPDGRIPRSCPDGECKFGPYQPGKGPASTFDGDDGDWGPAKLTTRGNPWPTHKPLVSVVPKGQPRPMQSCVFDKCRVMKPWEVRPTECANVSVTQPECSKALSKQAGEKKAWENEQHAKWVEANKPKNALTVSICGAIWGQVVGMVGGEACLNFDQYGIGVSAARKGGAGASIGGGLDLGIKVSQGHIEDLGGTGTWAGVPIGPVGVEISESDDKGPMAVGVSGGLSAGIGAPSFGREAATSTRLHGYNPYAEER
ncbi:RHS repeat-associated core domain-containing protein [Kibdelosporangium phytohabitans]|uniref:Uncharacterized protein n=1 Tax=Kibdelosporangium phytohabitans TaxID=860235 RepID=A0A0N9HVV2_9PSEU|nr:RHS repeat-associated core domain-containing protein [Kibdelosporangium phytohabitans]ALG11548.1 hypothetical protein AOZ06_35955 [Kibdelosporangium phytohabitans]MBE1462912.1 RHS repeat-associated protein [Kibdelosporangium phytohabitans]